MRQSQEFIEHPQLVHQLQRGGMDGVAAKVAEEVRVLFEHDHLNACAGEQQPEHHSGGAASNNTTSFSDLLRILLELTHSQCGYRIKLFNPLCVRNSPLSFVRLIRTTSLLVVPLPLKRITNRIREELFLQSVFASILVRVLIRRKLARNLEKSPKISRNEVASLPLTTLQNGESQSNEFFLGLA